VNAGYSPT